MALEEEHECDGGSDAAWMATFADLMSLLLTFFVLLLSFANMDVVRFRVVLGSVRDAFGVQFEHPGDMEAVSTSIIALSKQESSPSLKIMEEIMMLQKVKKFIKESEMENLMEASLTERGVVIRIKGHILFRSGDALLRKGGGDALEPVLKLTRAMPHQLSIEGHTDNKPIKSRKFPSNWELSTARSVSVMRFLVDNGLDPKRVNVAGYADMRPLESNSTRAGRAKNRRVEFIFLRSPEKEPITKEEIEAAKVELERMAKDHTLMDDPLGTADEEDENSTDTEAESEEAPVEESDAAEPEEAVAEEAAAEEAAADEEEEAPPSAPSIAPSLSPGIKASDVTPVAEAAATETAAEPAPVEE